MLNLRLADNAKDVSAVAVLGLAGFFTGIAGILPDLIIDKFLGKKRIVV